MTRPAVRLCCILLTAGIAACGGPRRTETPPLDRLYQGLADQLPRVDSTTLAGFRILIDPGHGGSFRGTVGRDSLEESKVNLGVSLYLWGLLREAGADAHLTRSADRDFLTEADSALAFDLQARVNAVDSLRPDLFISIHHNAQPQRDPAYNRVETYYSAGDPASLDLAFAIHRHLMRNLGIDVGEVRQGNYYILRNIDVPAVLGESSYLTHPPVEEQLRLSRAQELEAEAYFLGIVDYCRRGIPRVTALEPADSLHATLPAVSCRFEDHGGLGIDPDGVSLVLNGEPVRPQITADGNRATYELPWDAPNGTYDLAVSVRNVGGNTSRVARTRFAVAYPPALAAITTAPPRLPRDGGGMRVRARILDARGLPVADGTPVSLTTSLGGPTREERVDGGSVEFALLVPSGTRSELTLTLACGERRFETRVPRGQDGTRRSRAIVVRNARDGSPLVNATIVAGDSVVTGASPSGVYSFPADTGAHLHAPGYRPVPLDGVAADTLRVDPWFDGALLGQRFVLDPQGGKPRVAGVGPLGLAASYVNLRTATYLKAFLEAAGAEVLLTRTSDEVRLPEDVATMTNRFRADRYIELRHPSAPPDSALAVGAFFFPGSATGQKMAAQLGAALAGELGVPFPGPEATVTYPLQQTACPAIVVAAPSISDVTEELRLDSSAYLRKQAYGVFTGILHHYAVADGARLAVLVESSAPQDWLVTLDETWTLATGADGRVEFHAVPAGEHTVVARRGTDIRRATLVIGSDDVRFSIPASQ
ncbi:MAG TPA: N-acetylmuramoyl-L-alanine amidase [Candidatus Krumholzibacteria bacterium]|nr:N-acetylmuramoyl-L-alanine amidase [Candidatus Krumholzibacteria bacterium]